MGIFGKKKKLNEDEYVVEETNGKVGQNKVIKNKDLKDLNSENKNKRREPKKPWGKHERYIVLFLLVLSAGLSTFLWLSASGWKISDFLNLNFKMPLSMTEETIVIESK